MNLLALLVVALLLVMLAPFWIPVLLAAVLISGAIFILGCLLMVFLGWVACAIGWHTEGMGRVSAERNFEKNIIQTRRSWHCRRCGQLLRTEAPQ